MGKTHRKEKTDNRPNCRYKWDMPHKSKKDYARKPKRQEDLQDQEDDDEMTWFFDED